MRRFRLFEIHEQKWLPEPLRQGITDVLQYVLNCGGYARVVAPLLRNALREAGARRVIDLCAGSGGPWPSLLALLGSDVEQLCLTDRFPNTESLRHFRLAERDKAIYCESSVDAEHVPSRLNGFRTVFNSFHHFEPGHAANLLRDATARNEGIAVFELPGRNVRTMLLTCLVAPAAFCLVPLVRPRRPAHFLWTYAVPAIPAILLFDGIVSCLRAYTAAELEQIGAAAAHDYKWTAGIAGSGLTRVTYLIGVPRI